MPILECRRVVFFSRLDEAAFFGQLEANRAVRKIEAVGDTIRLHVARALSEPALRDLLATFHRYKIRMDQLAQLASDRNRPWFTDPRAYWHRGVFGKPPPAGPRRPPRR